LATALGGIDHRGHRLKKPGRHVCGLVDNAALPTGSTGRNSNNRPERNQKFVTHVAGQICHLSPAAHNWLRHVDTPRHAAERNRSRKEATNQRRGGTIATLAC
jgi:hypothetical protein